MFAVRTLNRVGISLSRTYTATAKLIEVTHDDEGIATVSMMRPPVNNLNKELLNALNTTLTDIQKQKCKGIILTSSLSGVFTAGLDIMEMYNRTQEQLTEFWQALQDAWLTLYNCDVPIAAAINGSSPAGGCLLALSCEYRVFVEGNHTIGLNETKLGVTAPVWFQTLYIETLGYRRAELALLRGSLFSPKEALEIGLVDELASDKENALKKCKDYITDFKNIGFIGRQKTKMELRRRNTLWLKVNKNEDLNEFLTVVQSPEIQTGLSLYMKSLKKAKK
ncbi:enoyl-CoA delta isomerase 1, mitochondrial [Xylocopa sonorina]|uniref:enoyl-CoA delta isomerase 1, mitochondrial n=1 Tax=Xylocopa sonorina TaxID=1818115 RepID=UPI00403A8AA3